jgi:hypothetical protein
VGYKINDKPAEIITQTVTNTVSSGTTKVTVFENSHVTGASVVTIYPNGNEVASGSNIHIDTEVTSESTIVTHETIHEVTKIVTIKTLSDNIIDIDFFFNPQNLSYGINDLWYRRLVFDPFYIGAGYERPDQKILFGITMVF